MIDQSTFFVFGGTLSQSAVSYVSRQADDLLYTSLIKGEFCYILTSRQMGKSSLMVRTAAKLREHDILVAMIDLTRQGQNLTVDQWYKAMLNRIGMQFDLEDELDDFWSDYRSLPPLERWMTALQKVVIPRSTSPVILFIDEIDMVRSLPFKTDEFFAGIRACYNSREREPEFNRLTFCLLGVAAPTDLIDDAHITPFNIGTRIELQDFTHQEALTLAAGLSLDDRDGESLLGRILYWTGGHPYLTQCLCAVVAGEEATLADKDVDRLCKELFFSADALEREKNLSDVSSRLLRSKENIADLLDLYGKVRRGQRIPYDETDPLCRVLRLSGVVTVMNGTVVVRNRIYEQVFDRRWVRKHMPNAELERQRMAYLRGMALAMALSASIITIVAGLAIYGLVQTNRANRNAQEANRNAKVALTQKQRADQKALAETEARIQAGRDRVGAIDALQKAREQKDLADRRLVAATAAHIAEIRARQDAIHKAALARRSSIEASRQADAATRMSYIATLNLIQRDWEANDLDHVTQLLEQTRESKFRGFEWGYWNRLCHLELLSLHSHMEPVSSVAYSPDGKYVLTGSNDGTAILWNAATGSEIFTLIGHTNAISAVTFSADGKYIATSSSSKFLPFGRRKNDYTVRVWKRLGSTDLFQTVYVLHHVKGVRTIAFSPDSRRIVTGCDGDTQKPIVTLTIWDFEHKSFVDIKSCTKSVSSVVYCPDGKSIVSLNDDGTVSKWDPTSNQLLLSFKSRASWPPPGCMALSPNGQHIAIGYDNGVEIREAVTGRELFVLTGHTGTVASLAFSPNGKHIATANGDNTASIWDADTGKELLVYKGHTRGVTSIAFSPDGQRILTGSADHTAKVWDATATKEALLLTKHQDQINVLAFSPDGKRIFCGGTSPGGRVLDLSTGRELLTMQGMSDANVGNDFGTKYHLGWNVNSAVYSLDGKRIAAGCTDSIIRIWDANTGNESLNIKRRGNGVTSVAFSPDGKDIVAGYDNSLEDIFTSMSTSHWPEQISIVWDAQTGKQRRFLKGHTRHVAAVAYSSDGRRIVTAGSDGTARIRDNATGQTMMILKTTSSINAISMSPDGKHLATGNADGTANVWDVTTGHTICTLKGHRSGVVTIAYSPDGKRIVTGSIDNTARLWDAVTGREVLTLNGFHFYAKAVAFSPSGKELVAGCLDGTVKIWSTSFDYFPIAIDTPD
jgi:WD40 repeat protein